MINKILIIFICWVCFSACSGHGSSNVTTIYINELPIDSTVLPLNHSGKGCFLLKKDSLVYFDEHFCTIATSNISKLSFGRSRLGIKDSLLYQKTILAGNISKGVYYGLSNYTIWNFGNAGASIQKEHAFTFPATQSGYLLETEPSPNNPAVYEPDYITPSFIIINDSAALINITAEHPYFNAYTSFNFYSNGFSVAQVDLKRNRVTKLIAKRKGIYLKKSFIPFFHSALIGYQQANKKTMITYEADSLIYVYDENFQLQASFGNRPIYFSDNYPVTNKIAVAFDAQLMSEQRKKFGRNTALMISDDGAYVLRVYQTGVINEQPCQNRVQVYENGNYKKDILLPTGAAVAGIHENQILAAKLFNEEGGKVVVYRILLD